MDQVNEINLYCYISDLIIIEKKNGTSYSNEILTLLDFFVLEA